MSLFMEMLEFGQDGENAIQQYYKKQGNIIYDVSKDERYWNKDVDFIINGQKVEVKTDTRIAETKNFCFELVSNSDRDRYKEGWFFTSEADVFIIYSPQTSMSYQLLSSEIRELYDRHQQLFVQKKLTFKEYEGLEKHSVVGIIPIDKVKKYCRNYREVKISDG